MYGDVRPGFEYAIYGRDSEGRVCVVKHSYMNFFTAKFTLEAMLKKPTKADEFLTKGLTDFFVEEVESASAWWNDPGWRNEYGD